jgi:hypothetical protein
MNYYNNETILEQQKQIENLTTALEKVSDYNLRLENERDKLLKQGEVLRRFIDSVGLGGDGELCKEKE